MSNSSSLKIEEIIEKRKEYKRKIIEEKYELLRSNMTIKNKYVDSDINAFFAPSEYHIKNMSSVKLLEIPSVNKIIPDNAKKMLDTNLSERIEEAIAKLQNRREFICKTFNDKSNEHIRDFYLNDIDNHLRKLTRIIC